MLYLKAIEMLDGLHPSEFYVGHKEQHDAPGARWTLRYRYDGGNVEGRMFTNDELRTILLKALAYDALMGIGLND
jgi:hypothetical protein